MANVTIRQEVVNIWIFVFPPKENSTDWEASTEKLFSTAPNFFLDFSQQLLTFFLIFLSSSIMRAKIEIVFTLARLAPKLLLHFSQQLHNASRKLKLSLHLPDCDIGHSHLFKILWTLKSKQKLFWNQGIKLYSIEILILSTKMLND